MRRRRSSEADECPNCGAAFPAGRPACPECGSDRETGWLSGEEIDYQAVPLPEDEIDYVALGLEPPPGAPRPRRSLFRSPWLALLVLAALVILFLRLLW